MNIQDLTGKTIKSATKMKKPEYDDEGFLRIYFTDGTSCDIVAWYGGYSGDSEDEYPTDISVHECDSELIPVDAQ